MSINITLKRNLFNPSFLPYLTDYSHRYEVYLGGAGSGKSFFVVQKILFKAIQSRRKVLVVRKVANTLRDSIFQLTLDTLAQWKLIDYCDIHRSTMTITLPNGSILLFKGLDNVEKLKSITGITDIVAEEFSELYEEDYLQLDLRLRENAPNLQFIMMSNPVSKATFLYSHFFKNGTPNDTFIMRSNYKNNKFLPKAYVDSLEEMINTNPIWYKIYTLGEFASLGKRVYTNWSKGFAPEDKTNLQFVVGLDFGYTMDPSAFVASWVDKENRIIYIDREYGRKGMLNVDIYNAAVELGVAKDAIVGDSAEPKSIEELKRLGLRRIKPSVKGGDSVIHGIQRIQSYRIVVNPGCIKTIEELDNYSYKKDPKTGEYLNQPEDIFNHYLDALRYSMQLVDEQHSLKTMSKIGLGI